MKSTIKSSTKATVSLFGSRTSPKPYIIYLKSLANIPRFLFAPIPPLASYSCSSPSFSACFSAFSFAFIFAVIFLPPPPPPPPPPPFSNSCSSTSSSPFRNIGLGTTVIKSLLALGCFGFGGGAFGSLGFLGPYGPRFF